jgi:hypothetical protein
MAWWTDKDGQATPEATPFRPVLFQPEPLAGDVLGGDVKAGKKASRAKASAPAKAKRKATGTPPAPARAAAGPRTPLQEKMAEIAKKHKDGPIEDMTGPIREALAAHGRTVPDDWILAIAEGLRQHGPISLNLGPPDSAPR